jgi:hypothetical protein
MILYAVVLIIVMLCTWSPKIKGMIAVAANAVKRRTMKLFGKKPEEVGTNE